MYSLRLANESDLVAIAEIEQRVAHYPWTPSVIAQSYKCGDLFFVLDDMSGYYCVMIADKFAELRSISVLPLAQRQKRGTLMIEHMIELCKLSLIEQVFLEVAVDNTQAISLYKKSGFETVGIRKRYYGDKDAFVMELRFIQ